MVGNEGGWCTKIKATRKGELVVLFEAFQAHPGRLDTIASGSHPLVRFRSLSEYCQMRRYHAHWLREPSALLASHVEMEPSREVFAPHSPEKKFLLETILP
jgi:hypothetical protein